MKKMMIALVAMFVMTMSANAQSVNNESKLTFDRLSSYLELRVDQVEPVKTAMAQFATSMEAYYQLSDASKAGEAWEKIQANHKKTMKAVEQMLPADKFLRIHRSYIVATDKIRKIDRNDCVYIGKEIIHVPDGYLPAFRAFLESRSPS